AVAVIAGPARQTLRAHAHHRWCARHPGADFRRLLAARKRRRPEGGVDQPAGRSPRSATETLARSNDLQQGTHPLDRASGKCRGHALAPSAASVTAATSQLRHGRYTYSTSHSPSALDFFLPRARIPRLGCRVTPHARLEDETMQFGGKVVLAVVAAAFALILENSRAAVAAPKEIHIDWATYNPVSMVLKEKRLLENEFSKDGISIVWVQTLGSNKALEFLNAGSIDFGSTAGSAALVSKINGNPIKSIYVYSRPEWTALVTTKDSNIQKIADLKGRRVAVTRGTDPHIFLVRALQSVGLTEKDIVPVLLQHPDGKTALIRGDVDAWAGLDPMMAQAELQEGARLFYRNRDANTWGILNVREPFAQENPDIVRRVLAVYEEARKFSLANYDELKRTFIAATRLPENVVDKQLKERTELTHNRIGAPQRESILAAGLALQQAGVVPANVAVAAVVDDLIDDRFLPVSN